MAGSFRLVACAAILLAWGGVRLLPHLPALPPSPVVLPAKVPFPEVLAAAGPLSQDERHALSEAYGILSRSIAGNPQEEPVFADLAAVRKAHRAALLCVWQGVLSNREGQVPGLGQALEAAISGRLGDNNVPLNPTLQAEAVRVFADIATTLQ